MFLSRASIVSIGLAFVHGRKNGSIHIDRVISPMSGIFRYSLAELAGASEWISLILPVVVSLYSSQIDLVVFVLAAATIIETNSNFF